VASSKTRSALTKRERETEAATPTSQHRTDQSLDSVTRPLTLQRIYEIQSKSYYYGIDRLIQTCILSSLVGIREYGDLTKLASTPLVDSIN
jgi:N-acetyl-beta-hexosaminidase